MGSCLSLVIPAYNEADRLGSRPAATHGGGLPRQRPRSSSSTTAAPTARPTSPGRVLAAWPRTLVVSLPKNRGKGAAVRVGVAHARGDIIGYVDADMGTDPKDLKLLVEALDRSHVAVGSRAHEHSVVKRDDPSPGHEPQRSVWPWPP